MPEEDYERDSLARFEDAMEPDIYDNDDVYGNDHEETHGDLEPAGS